MKANEEYERKWYEHCKGSGAWRPIRQELHDASIHGREKHFIKIHGCSLLVEDTETLTI